MKRRRTKKWPFFMLLVLIALVFGTLYFFKDDFIKGKKNVEEEEETLEKKEFNASFTLAGGILINSNMWTDSKTAEGYDFSKMFEDANDIMKKSDINFYFQDSILGGNDLGASAFYNYNTPNELLDTLTKMGFNMASLGSYHAYDKGLTGITNSMKLLKDKKVTYSGINDSEKANNSNIITKKGMKIGLLSYTIGLDEVVNEEYAVNVYDADKAKTDIENLKKNVDLVIVSIDWNNLNSSEVTESQKEIATKLSELGANIVVGNSYNGIQPIEMINNTLVCYSLGNLLSGHTLIDSRISAMVDFDVKVIDKDVKINDINVSLYYAYNLNGRNYKVIPFAKISNELANYKTYYDKYKELLTKDNNEIKFYNIGE